MKTAIAMLFGITALVSSAAATAFECTPDFEFPADTRAAHAELVAHEFDLKLFALLEKQRKEKQAENEEPSYN